MKDGHQRYTELNLIAAEQAKNILMRIDTKEFIPRKTQGAEFELFLVDDTTGHPVSETIRDSIIALCEKEMQKIGADITQELGGCAVEIRTPPVEVKPGFATNVCRVVGHSFNCLAKVSQLFRVIPLGAGTLGCENIPLTTTKEKYRRVPAYHNEHRRRSASLRLGSTQTELKGAESIAATGSIHINIAATDPEEALSIANSGLAFDGLTTAIHANAPVISGAVVPYQDVRIEAWERTHDTRDPRAVVAGQSSRVGLPSDYFHSLRDYFDNVLINPILLDVPDEVALATKIGTSWWPVRMKFPNNLLLVEWRMPSAQPSARETSAAWVFLGGLAEAGRAGIVKLPEFAIVRENSWRGRRGLDRDFLVENEHGATTRVPGRVAATSMFYLAREGLRCLDALDDKAEELIVGLEKRVWSGMTPAKTLVSVIHEYQQKMPLPQAIALAQLHLQRVA
ncbi:MAG: glutamate-cysteine ligase family protein [Promethearchaeota archaeon]